MSFYVYTPLILGPSVHGKVLLSSMWPFMMARQIRQQIPTVILANSFHEDKRENSWWEQIFSCSLTTPRGSSHHLMKKAIERSLGWQIWWTKIWVAKSDPLRREEWWRFGKVCYGIYLWLRAECVCAHVCAYGLCFHVFGMYVWEWTLFWLVD